MISRIDIEDWDQESHQAYLKWAEDYGINYEPWIGHPDIFAAWKAAVVWMSEKDWVGLTDEDVSASLSKYQGWREFAAELENILKAKNQ